MAADISQGDLIHPKALRIHGDKLGEKAEELICEFYQETPHKSKLAEGEEENAEPDGSSEESISTVEEQENETPPATSSEAEQPKGEPESGEKEENNNKSAEEPKKE